MANRHFGNIGDVWKHLPLAEALAMLRPRRYWETHAGSAAYPLTHSPGRDYGAWHFHRHANQSPAVESSAYAGLLREAFGVEPSYYPGSPLIAMRLLEKAAGPDGRGEYLFCDRDTHSLEDIARHARELNIPPARLATEDGDGVTAVARAAERLSADGRPDTFVFIDPYDPFARSGELGAAELFARLSALGFPCMLWWGYDSRAEAQWSWVRVNAALNEQAPPVTTGRRLWGGEITLKAIDEPGAAPPGVFGCVVLCANVPAEVTDRCRELGGGLEDIYRDAVAPDGKTGEIEFHEVDAGA